MPCSATKLFLCLLLFVPTAGAGQPAIFQGELDRESVATFMEKYATASLDTLVISSPGGEVEAGIQLGWWVRSKALNVVVDGVCLSSCANYVFTAGINKTLTPGSFVGWHGNYHHLDRTGLWRDDVLLRMRRDGEDRQTATRKVRAQVEHLLSLEEMFFSRTGVDEYICWVGKMPPHNAADYYTLTADDMARFGVTNVSLPADYRESIKLVTSHNVVFIDL